MEKIRLQKFLASSGVASRRKCEEYISEGRVKVNGEVAEIGTKVDPENDEIIFDGKLLDNKTEKEFTYILLNKPIGVVTTAEDQFNRETVLDIVKVKQRVVPVGRLDMYTSGALILTDDGDFIFKVTHPKHEIEKTYTVTLKGIADENDIVKLREGVEIDDVYITKPAKARIMKIDKEKNISRVEIVIHEGKNRQVRKMCEAIGKRVLALHRSKIGPIGVKDLKIGTWRYLKKTEVEKILN
jgi:23S rRNA pseudouridine2605 synthase